MSYLCPFKIFVFFIKVILFSSFGVNFVFSEESSSSSKSTPWEVFQLGFSAYEKGEKDQAVRAYQDAAQQGQIAAAWKLAHMYSQGDGVSRDHYKAYKLFSRVVDEEVEPGSPDESYIANALAEIGCYVRDGIPHTPVVPDPVSALEYFRKSAIYGSPVGQFELGKMYVFDSSSSYFNQKQAARWLMLAMKKGHQGARAVLGNLMFNKGNIVDGLAMMTAALALAPSSDQLWIQAMQENAFAITEEKQRRQAIDRAENILTADVEHVSGFSD